MCEFQRVPPSRVIDGEYTVKSLPMCKYTRSPCTYCVLGNSKTYNEAIKAKEQNK